MNTHMFVAAFDIALVTFLIYRRFDVRLVLILGSVPLFAATGGLGPMFAKIVTEMANPGTVVPIGSALGFAYVLRVTECDRHLIQLLLRPLRRVRWLLIPGGIGAGYLVNTTIVSQTGTAAVLGPILIPLLRAGRISPVTSGAILLLGSSMGGELFNPGAVEMRKLAELTGLTGPQVVGRSTPLNLLASGTALLAFWLLSLRHGGNGEASETGEGTGSQEGLQSFKIDPIKALIPILPLVLLFSDTALDRYSPLHTLEGPSKILAAMLIGVTAAGITTPSATTRLASAFFEGAGYAYTHVISLIVAASTYAEGIRLVGLIGLLVKALVGLPTAAMVVSTVAPWFLAFVSGTGIAPAVSVMEFFVPVAPEMGLDPVRLGTVTAMGAHFGRTMSPAAAVVVLCAQLAGAPAAELIRRVAPPLLIGGVVFLSAALLGLV